MTETPATQPTSVIPDDTLLEGPSNTLRLAARIKELTTQQYITTWMLVETAAIAELLTSAPLTAGQVWQLVLPHYNISPNVSSTPNPDSDPNWLTQPLADHALVWEHLTALCAGQELPPVPALPGPHGNHDDQAKVLIEQYLVYLTRSLNLLERRCRVNGGDLMDRLKYKLRHDIEHRLSVQWLGTPYTIGASLHNLPLSGSGGFGTDGQSVFFLKALVAVLKHELNSFPGATSISKETSETMEARGRIGLWWLLLKGYVYAMLNTESTLNVPAMMLRDADLIADLKQVLLRAFEVLQMPEAQTTPEWGGSGASELDNTITSTPTRDLVAELDARITAEQHNQSIWNQG